MLLFMPIHPVYIKSGFASYLIVSVVFLGISRKTLYPNDIHRQR